MAMERSLEELATLVDGEVEGDATVRVARLATIEEAGPTDLTFLANPRYRRFLATTRAAAVILGPGVACDRLPVIRCDDPYLAFARILRLFHPMQRPPAGIDPRAWVEAGAQIGASSTLMAGCFVAAGAQLGERVVLHPGCYIGQGARLGDDCYLYPNVVVREGVQIGARCILQPGAIIGADGFGYAQTDEGALKIPQVGAVRLGDDVEIGANACIDRGALGDTVIGAGVKIDNLVQIAHNVRIGDHTIITAMVGVAGSTTIGGGCAIGGHSAIAGHLEIGDGVSIAAMSGVPGNLRGGQVYAGIPVQEHRAWRRMIATLPRLPEMRKEIESLHTRLAALEGLPTDEGPTEA
ncbi:MAG: UDP-3-O-(3-hydroxymyristoyl)glucosamine N-acyltransferase [Nitrospirae bacterium CG18_big_fil_WC_8_21_14_2_50_70_55]|nr:MAG: UDP-3-O-(3-hydroxymyristoyl)glucosamine N-acyltransferase [Nitrospirae bacterium CG18_big_fil_WC_8_21_14_2_50_70_55]PIU77557.1 MAG: UDP-3-O-(3-hydroxymyristoyl)glucosamine N-acyltransferase [Nitrospirae bacterium CG06_land_8_20_14_3_00_70_43]PIW83685.1 MAG: UDP-3-O-(3-hydroxymyristoyl)glucosamine N-acyltransferase [Nitrospirae bacterium CG_4_8_14_3_um_filter_70_85]PIX83040.1 MAG: UDP-3-O-(3-hydroxymyristoyl)glucosamine N-acyltransferase [Nitrospirae bacterium CG_4_10_14_3_um_filter_70_10